MIALAVLAAIVCVWLLFPAPGPGLDRLSPKTRPSRNVGRWKICFGVVVAGGILAILVQPLVLVVALGMVGMTLVWVVVGRMNLKKALQRTKDVARAAQILESLLALGHIPTTALKLASEECPVIEPAVASVHMGGDPWEVMEHLARVPGQAGLSAIGQAWRVSHVSGSSMHEGLERVRKNLEEAASTADVVAGELAGPRATGQLLAVLPLIGIAMAYGLGADPIQFFTSSVMGRACFIVGLGLGCLGVIWSEILAIQVSGLGGSRKKE